MSTSRIDQIGQNGGDGMHYDEVKKDMIAHPEKYNGAVLTATEAQELQVGTYDPTGKDQHEPGAKVDAGKCELGLIQRGFAKALFGVGTVGTFGANKYTRNGWETVPEAIRRYTDAMYRHLNAYHQGEEVDADSGLPHLDHAAWNMLAVLELTKRETDNAN